MRLWLKYRSSIWIAKAQCSQLQRLLVTGTELH